MRLSSMRKKQCSTEKATREGHGSLAGRLHSMRGMRKPQGESYVAGTELFRGTPSSSSGWTSCTPSWRFLRHLLRHLYDPAQPFEQVL